MTNRYLTIVGLGAGMLAVWAIASESRADASRGAVAAVKIVGRTIVMFAPPSLLAEAKRREDGASAALEHMEMGMAEMRQCLSRSKRPALIRRIYAREMIIHQDGHSEHIVFPTEINKDIGVYMFEPGRKPCRVLPVNGAPSSLVMALPSAAGEYFGARRCIDPDLHGFCADGG